MEEIYAACFMYEPNLLDYIYSRKLNEPTWILGKRYDTMSEEGVQELNDDVSSKLWFTYRRNFPPIGATTFTSDSGWGCMHRCGQMVLAQTLIMQQLGRDWIWKHGCDEPIYKKILHKFNDNEACTYSIHRMAVQGDVLDKSVGEWFGPNTAAQVLRMLTTDDQECNLIIHTALDNMVIKNEIEQLCQRHQNKQVDGHKIHSNADLNTISREVDAGNNTANPSWTPLLLVIPLRLGLDEIIPSYFEKLKAVFMFKQCVGFLGGRTNHASYFVGFTGDELIYLDPHTTQEYYEIIEDSTYHCLHPARMNFKLLEPSIALCFYCKDQEDFERWCTEAQNVLLKPETDALFDILENKPQLHSFLENPPELFSLSEGAAAALDSDEEFEIL